MATLEATPAQDLYPEPSQGLGPLQGERQLHDPLLVIFYPMNYKESRNDIKYLHATVMAGLGKRSLPATIRR